jgi:hypothetical protein
MEKILAQKIFFLNFFWTLYTHNFQPTNNKPLKNVSLSEELRTHNESTFSSFIDFLHPHHGYPFFLG